MGISDLLGVETVENAIKVFTEVGSCHVVPLRFTCQVLYLCQGLYPHKKPSGSGPDGDSHGSKWGGGGGGESS